MGGECSFIFNKGSPKPLVVHETFPRQEGFSVQRDQRCHDCRVITHLATDFLGSPLLHLPTVMPSVFPGWMGSSPFQSLAAGTEPCPGMCPVFTCFGDSFASFMVDESEFVLMMQVQVSVCARTHVCFVLKLQWPFNVIIYVQAVVAMETIPKFPDL